MSSYKAYYNVLQEIQLHKNANDELTVILKIGNTENNRYKDIYFNEAEFKALIKLIDEVRFSELEEEQ